MRRAIDQHVAWIVAMGAVLLQSCGSASQTVSTATDRGAPTTDEVAVTRRAGDPELRGSHDRVLHQIWQAEPTFAGFWVDEAADRTIVMLTRAQDESVADNIARLLAIAFDDPTFIDRDVRARGGARCSFGELFDWHRSVRSEVGSVRGWSLSDIDEQRNRIVIGLEDLSAEGRVERLLERQGVPRDAVVLQEIARARAEVDAEPRRREPLR